MCLDTTVSVSGDESVRFGHTLVCFGDSPYPTRRCCFQACSANIWPSANASSTTSFPTPSNNPSSTRIGIVSQMVWYIGVFWYSSQCLLKSKCITSLKSELLSSALGSMPCQRWGWLAITLGFICPDQLQPAMGKFVIAVCSPLWQPFHLEPAHCSKLWSLPTKFPWWLWKWPLQTRKYCCLSLHATRQIEFSKYICRKDKVVVCSQYHYCVKSENFCMEFKPPRHPQNVAHSLGRIHAWVVFLSALILDSNLFILLCSDVLHSCDGGGCELDNVIHPQLWTPSPQGTRRWGHFMQVGISTQVPFVIIQVESWSCCCLC